MSNILLISYLYPPVQFAGTRRVTRFVKYLPDVGYSPYILTTATRGDLPDDEQNRVFRVGEILGGIKRAYRNLRLKEMPFEQHASAIITPSGRFTGVLRGIAIPDMQITWYITALRKARALIQIHSIDILYSTSGPETNHLVALKMKRETNLPWIADFRDGWLFEPLIAERLTLKPRYALEKCLERAVVQSADHITTVNESIAADISQRYPDAAHKVTVISNGFDADSFAGLQRQPDSVFRLTHTGSLSLSRQGTLMEGLLNALKLLKSEDHPLLRDIKIAMVGELTTAEVEAIDMAGVREYFEIIGKVSYQEALQHQVNAEVLLLITHPDQLAISTTKLFEYLAARRPILALTPPDSAAALIIQSIGAGEITSPMEAEAIRATLIASHEKWRTGQFEPLHDTEINQYDYRMLTKKLASILDKIVK